MFIGISTAVFFLKVLCLFVGPAIAYNSAKALRKGEGMYDRESTEIMTAGGWLGIAFGIAISVWGFMSIFGPLLWPFAKP